MECVERINGPQPSRDSAPTRRGPGSTGRVTSWGRSEPLRAKFGLCPGHPLRHSTRSTRPCPGKNPGWGRIPGEAPGLVSRASVPSPRRFLSPAGLRPGGERPRTERLTPPVLQSPSRGRWDRNRCELLFRTGTVTEGGGIRPAGIGRGGAGTQWPAGYRRLPFCSRTHHPASSCSQEHTTRRAAAPSRCARLHARRPLPRRAGPVHRGPPCPRSSP